MSIRDGKYLMQSVIWTWKRQGCFERVDVERRVRSIMAAWDYAANGPATWAKSFPLAAGKKQSPIDIDPSSASKQAGSALVASYNPATSNTLTNTGLSFQVSVDGTLSGGPLGNEYKAASFHFHWGTSNAEGSEHTVNGKAYAAEAHIVHYNAAKYASFPDAVKADDGLAVLATFIQLGAANSGVQNIVDLLSSVPNKGDTATIPGGFDAACLLPSDQSKYWFYPGSLTTPPCFESVTWIVYKDPIQMGETQLAELRKITGCNFRPTLGLCGRQVSSSF
ncbi:Carbonic anhydrase 1 [Lamellibrachia satsuma]|nr:Carbonic anhydrase 1 [Lamellibrachia satsuma]